MASTSSSIRSHPLKHLGNFAWVLPALVLLGVFVYLPLVQNVGFSTLEWDIYSGSQDFIGFANYVKLAGDPIFWNALGNNILYAVISIVFQVFGAFVLAAVIESIRSDRWRQSPAGHLLRAVGDLAHRRRPVCSTSSTNPTSACSNAGLDAARARRHGPSPGSGSESTAIYGIIAMSQWQGFGYSHPAVRRGHPAHSARALRGRRRSTVSGRPPLLLHHAPA